MGTSYPRKKLLIVIKIGINRYYIYIYTRNSIFLIDIFSVKWKIL